MKSSESIGNAGSATRILKNDGGRLCTTVVVSDTRAKPRK